MKKTMLNAVQKVKMAMGKKMPKLSMEYPKLKGGFGSLSVKAGIDNNPNPTQADRIAGATMKKRKPKMAMAKKKAKMAMAKKKPKLMGPGLGQKKGKRKKPKMAMRKKK
tara:strand:+ start:1099 stop:1425 length:327 start_codon:yes stop_codon:yes gene_type:complete